MEQILSKDESLRQIVRGIKEKGFLFDIAEINNFLENFEIKYQRLPRLEEIELIVESYIQFKEERKLSTIKNTINEIKKKEETKKSEISKKEDVKYEFPRNKKIPLGSREREDRILTISKPEGRRNCPICGNSSWFKIHESLDKTHVISTFPRVYGKKYSCSGCGCQWRET